MSNDLGFAEDKPGKFATVIKGPTCSAHSRIRAGGTHPATDVWREQGRQFRRGRLSRQKRRIINTLMGSAPNDPLPACATSPWDAQICQASYDPKPVRPASQPPYIALRNRLIRLKRVIFYLCVLYSARNSLPDCPREISFSRLAFQWPVRLGGRGVLMSCGPSRGWRAKAYRHWAS